ncbi:MAG: TIGR02300 family protein [Sphingomonadales bacterium]|nr:TIGR02300 family protein [Sphingomonadales bacterium]
MAKPEWGTKRRCPKCGERFYDLNHAYPLACIGCGHQFEPETVLKSKQPMAEEEVKVVRKAPIVAEADEELLDEELLDEDLELGDEVEDEELLDDELGEDDDMSDVIEKRTSDEG